MICKRTTCFVFAEDVIDSCDTISCDIDVIEFDNCHSCTINVSGGCKDVLVKSCKLDDCLLCCDPHQSGFFWNNWCNCEGAMVTGRGSLSDVGNYDSTRAINACDCAYTQSWKFRGAGTYTVTMPEQKKMDTVILWGHNLHEGSTDTLFGQVQVWGDGVQLSPTNWDFNFASVDEDEPVFMFFEEGYYNEIRVLVGGAVVDAENCVDNLFIGECLDLPEGLRTFANPFNGSEYDPKIKASECGPLSRSLKKTAKDMDLQIEGLCEEWLRDKWRPFICYLTKFPAYFSWSKNRFPDEVGRVWIESCAPPSEYTDSHFSSVTLPLKIQTTQSVKK